MSSSDVVNVRPRPTSGKSPSRLPDFVIAISYFSIAIVTMVGWMYLLSSYALKLAFWLGS